MSESESIVYRHTVTNKIKRSDSPRYMEITGFVPWDGEVEVSKTGVKTAHLGIAELRTLAEEAGVSKAGSKVDIQQRLLDAQNTPTTPPETPGTSSDGAADSSSTPAGEDSETPQKEG